MTIADMHLTDKNVATMHALLYGKKVDLGVSIENACITVYGDEASVIFRENLPMTAVSVEGDGIRIGSRLLRVDASQYDSEEEALAILEIIAMMAQGVGSSANQESTVVQDPEDDGQSHVNQPVNGHVQDDDDDDDEDDNDDGDGDDDDDDGNQIGLPSPPNTNQSKRLVDIGWELTNWAIANKVEDDPYVDALTSTIDQRGNLTAFATTNPIDLLPMPEARAGAQLRRIARVVTVTRNVLVFVPVLITWWAISEATRAYGRYVDALKQRGSDESTSFLEFWESGGVGVINPALPKFWRITDVAIKDALIIAAIILLTFIAGLIESYANARRQTAETRIEKDRTRVAVATMIALQGNKSVDTESLTDTLAIALNDLGQAARDVNLAAERMEAASVGVSSLTPRVAELSANVGELSNQFSSEVQVSIQALVTAVATLGNTLEGDLQRFMTEVLAGLEEVTEKLRATGTGVEFGTKQLREDLDAIHSRLQGLIQTR
jgi:hypothetical protein